MKWKLKTRSAQHYIGMRHTCHILARRINFSHGALSLFQLDRRQVGQRRNLLILPSHYNVCADSGQGLAEGKNEVYWNEQVVLQPIKMFFFFNLLPGLDRVTEMHSLCAAGHRLDTRVLPGNRLWASRFCFFFLPPQLHQHGGSRQVAAMWNRLGFKLIIFFAGRFVLCIVLIDSVGGMPLITCGSAVQKSARLSDSAFLHRHSSSALLSGR